MNTNDINNNVLACNKRIKEQQNDATVKYNKMKVKIMK